MVKAGANGFFVKALLPFSRVTRSSNSSSGVIADTQIAFSEDVNDTSVVDDAFGGNSSIPSEPAQSIYFQSNNIIQLRDREKWKF